VYAASLGLALANTSPASRGLEINAHPWRLDLTGAGIGPRWASAA
jgi:hypothetical protein